MIIKKKFIISHLLIITATSVFTASIASLFLSSALILIILITKKFDLNLDNIATPLAASLGDLVTLGVLAVIGNTLIYESSIMS